MAPAELEALLLTHPKIADVAVIGVPNERLGEAPKAFIVKKDESLTEKEVEECISLKVKVYCCFENSSFAINGLYTIV